MTHRHSTSQTKHHINSRTDEQFKLPQKKWTSGVGCNMILVSEIRQWRSFGETLIKYNYFLLMPDESCKMSKYLAYNTTNNNNQAF
jgi:hypothetical protein